MRSSGSSARRDLVKARAAWGEVCLKCWAKLAGSKGHTAWKELPWRGPGVSVMQSLSSQSYLAVLFQDPGRSLFCDHLCFCKWQHSVWDGWWEKHGALFSTSPILVLVAWLLVSTVVNYRESNSIAVVITTKIDLCSKWPSVVISCILRNKSCWCFFPWWRLVSRQYLWKATVHF